jgi:prophage DNA circulation protein
MLADGSAGFGRSVAASTEIARRAIADSANSESQVLDFIKSRTSDIASQGKLGFISNLDRVAAVDTDVQLITRQLSALIGNANASVSGISSAALNHMGLSRDILARLSSTEVSKLASVGDVMNAFSAIVTGFVNETVSSMKSAMTDMKSVDDLSNAKLGSIQKRAKAATDWVSAGINQTADGLAMQKERNGALQQALTASVGASQKGLETFSRKYNSDLQSLGDAIEDLKTTIQVNAQKQLDRVRQWVGKNRKR